MVTRNPRCHRCGKRHLRQSIMLELDRDTNRFYRPENFPKDAVSQGGFWFGLYCAEQQLKESSQQPKFTDCRNCGSVDHNDYRCPCACHAAM